MDAAGCAGWVSAFAPATVANVGPGFDCFGFALEGAGDVVRARLREEPGIVITAIENAPASIPRDVERNTAGVAARSLWETCAAATAGRGLELRIEKGLPVGSGLGSSAASAVAAAVATMELLVRCGGVERDEPRVLAAALDGEAAASGQRHADNVAPALFGGFTIVQPGDPPSVARLAPPAWFAAVVTPDVRIDTRAARALLPSDVPLQDAVSNWSAAASLVLALVYGNADLARRSLCDRVVEPVRATLIPGCAAAREAAMAAGALGAGISGSGPSLFAIAAERATAERCADAMRSAFADRELAAAGLVSRLGAEGACVR